MWLKRIQPYKKVYFPNIEFYSTFGITFIQRIYTPILRIKITGSNRNQIQKTTMLIFVVESKHIRGTLVLINGIKLFTRFVYMRR